MFLSVQCWQKRQSYFAQIAITIHKGSIENDLLLPMLRALGAEIFRGKAGEKFTFQMSGDEPAQTRRHPYERGVSAREGAGF